jgi:hypothetical protein
LTTIHVPEVLRSYFENFQKYGRLDDVIVIVIPDEGTPKEIFAVCRKWTAEGMATLCPDLEEQTDFLAVLDLGHFVPLHSDNRRNIGYLMALEKGVDFLISIDDDNYAIPEYDFFGEHEIVCAGEHEESQVSLSTGWYNACHLFGVPEEKSNFYARGFPYFARHRLRSSLVSEDKRMVTVSINAGLWHESPDLDGMTWCVAPALAEGLVGSRVLAPGTWSPVNSQNTAVRRDAIPAYWFVRMGGVIQNRLGDIFQGYFVQVCAKHLGHTVRFGTPMACHHRNNHDYLRDASDEMTGIRLLEEFLPWLTEQKLSGANYAEACLSLSELLREHSDQFPGFAGLSGSRDFLWNTALSMPLWVRACEMIGVS